MCHFNEPSSRNSAEIRLERKKKKHMRQIILRQIPPSGESANFGGIEEVFLKAGNHTCPCRIFAYVLVQRNEY